MDVYEASRNSSQLQLTVKSHWPVFCVGIGTSGVSASVLPVTLRLILAVGFSDTAAATFWDHRLNRCLGVGSSGGTGSSRSRYT